MPEGVPAPAAGPTPAPAGPSQPAQFTVPEGKMLVDSSEYQRAQEQLRGSKGYFESGSKYGFKSPQDFEKIGPHLQKLQQKGFSLEALAAAMEQDVRQPGQQENPLTQDAITKMLQEQENKFRQELSFRDALSQHEQSEAAYKSILEKQFGSLELPEELGPYKDIVREALEWQAYNKRPAYDANHPLAQYDVRYHDENTIKPIFDEFGKRITSAKAAALAAKGDAARKGRPQATPAGSTPTHPEPSSKDTKDGRARSGKLADGVDEFFSKRQAARGKGPLSTLGG